MTICHFINQVQGGGLAFITLERYPLDQCAIYKLQTKKKLAALLGLSLGQLKLLSEKSDKNYKIFDIHPEGRKSRTVEQPKPILERIHARIFRLLQRVETPGYLYSGVKGRSYVNNAAAHGGRHNLAKLDIKSFYPSTKSYRVYSFFNKTLQCSPDVSGILTRLTTCSGHVPTGSCLSQLLAYYSNKQMFDEIYAIASHSGVAMTCYVDDLVFSGMNVSRGFLFSIKKVIHKNGLKYHKERFYHKDQPCLVTGVIVKNNKLLVPNKLNKAIGIDLRSTCTLNEEELRSLVGRCNAASQIEARFSPLAIYARRILNNFST